MRLLKDYHHPNPDQEEKGGGGEGDGEGFNIYMLRQSIQFHTIRKGINQTRICTAYYSQKKGGEEEEVRVTTQLCLN